MPGSPNSTAPPFGQSASVFLGFFGAAAAGSAGAGVGVGVGVGAGAADGAAEGFGASSHPNATSPNESAQQVRIRIGEGRYQVYVRRLPLSWRNQGFGGDRSDRRRAAALGPRAPASGSSPRKGVARGGRR